MFKSATTMLKFNAIAFVALLAIAVGFAATTHQYNSNYESKTAAEKVQVVLDKLAATKGKQASWPSTFELVKIFFENMWPTVSDITDVMRSGRKKLIHSVGAVATVAFEYENSPYTGLFQGSNHAFARFSVAKEPNKRAKGFTPGVAFKMMRTAVPSANFMAMRNLTDQLSFNYFKNPFSNHISAKKLPFSLKMIVKKVRNISTRKSVSPPSTATTVWLC